MAFRPRSVTRALGLCLLEPRTRICTSAEPRGRAMSTMRAMMQSGPCLTLVADADSHAYNGFDRSLIRPIGTVATRRATSLNCRIDVTTVKKGQTPIEKARAGSTETRSDTVVRI